MKFQIEVIKSKIHRVTVTQANLNLSLIHISEPTRP